MATGGSGGGATTQQAGGGDFELQLLAYYGYDPMNRRVVRNANGQDHRYVYDGWREVEEMHVVGATATAQKSFVWGNGLDELLSYHRKEAGSWLGYYPSQDMQGSVVALLDPAGGIVERVEYDPYGKAEVYVGETGPTQPTSAVENPYLYTGRRLDSETGLLYLRNRYLHSGQGRFLTIDPLGSWSDPLNYGNGYAYVGNAPSMFEDPLGLMSVVDPGNT